MSVWREDGTEVALADLVADGPVLLLLYLFDWSPT